MTLSVSIKEIFLWRLSNAVIWSVLMQIVFLWCYLCVIYINIIHPIVWIQQTFTLLTSFQTWLRLVPTGSVIFLQGVFCGKEYLHSPPQYVSRFSFFISVFTLHNVTLCCLHMLSGGLTVWLYLSMLGGHYSSLIKNCGNKENSCLVEGKLFLLMSGFWNGMFHFIKDHILKPAIVTFPPIQQGKYIQVKSSISILFKKAMRDSLLPVFIFSILYYFEGYRFRDPTLKILKVTLQDEPIDSYFYIKNLSVLFYAWVFSTLFHTTMYTMSLLFNVYLTEHHRFNIEPAINTSTLSEALCEGPEILNKLAAQDLLEMAYKDRMRRNLIFSLSQPGGHPTNWTNLSSQCLQLINSYHNDLNNITNEKLGENPKSPPKPIYEPDIIKSPRLRNMAMSYPTSPITTKPVSPEESASDVIKNEVNIFLAALCKKPGINYVFGEITDLKLKWLILRGQIVSRVAQGLSQLVVTSLNEDTFGVVQDSLSSIITALIHLKQALDKLTKTGMAKKQDLVMVQMLTELKSAVKRSIYMITIKFGDYIRDIPLEPEVFQSLQSFVNLRE